MKIGGFIEGIVGCVEVPELPWAGLTDDELNQEYLGKPWASRGDVDEEADLKGLISDDDGVYNAGYRSDGDDEESDAGNQSDGDDGESDAGNQSNSDGGESDAGNQSDGDDGESDAGNPNDGDDEESDAGNQSDDEDGESDAGNHDGDGTIENENTKESNKKAPGFFTLPYDIRKKIYEELLRAKGTIKRHHDDYYHPQGGYLHDAAEADVHPQILATCRQINSECGNMLYDDNTFEMKIQDYSDAFHYVEQCNLSPQKHYTYQKSTPLFQRMKRIELVVEDKRWTDHVVDAIDMAGRVMAHGPALTYLSINVVNRVLQGRDLFSTSRAHRSNLRGLMMIRNVQQVTVQGLKPAWEQLLIERIKSPSSIPRMYYALEFFAKSIACAERALEQAYCAACLDDLQKFLSARHKVLKTVNEHLKHGADNLFSFDPIQQES